MCDSDIRTSDIQTAKCKCETNGDGREVKCVCAFASVLGERVSARVVGEDVGIIACTAAQRVIARAADECIVAATAVERVVAIVSSESIVLRVASDRVIATAADGVAGVAHIRHTRRRASC